MTLALDLRASGLSVILLESGGFRREAQTQRLSDGRMIGINTWNMRSMRIRALGGATGHWEGWCRPLMPQDFEIRDYIPNSGWPIRYSDLLPWYARACETLEIGPFQWDAEARAKAMGTAVLPTGAAIDHRYYQFSPPTRFARVYGGALEKAENVRVIAHANVADIRLDRERADASSPSRAARSPRQSSTCAPTGMCSRLAGSKTPACFSRRDRSSRKASRMPTTSSGGISWSTLTITGRSASCICRNWIAGSTHGCRRI